jgi:uncharacterized protein (DUF2461 family)
MQIMCKHDVYFMDARNFYSQNVRDPVEDLIIDGKMILDLS